jgi:hypothetical protein
MTKNPHAVALGRLGGQQTSEAKQRSSAANGKKGGRPRKSQEEGAETMSHFHTFDLHPKFPTMIACTQCGFSVPAIVLKSRVNVEAAFARQRCTSAVLGLLLIDRDGNPTTHPVSDLPAGGFGGHAVPGGDLSVSVA